MYYSNWAKILKKVIIYSSKLYHYTYLLMPSDNAGLIALKHSQNSLVQSSYWGRWTLSLSSLSTHSCKSKTKIQNWSLIH